MLQALLTRVAQSRVLLDKGGTMPEGNVKGIL